MGHERAPCRQENILPKSCADKISSGVFIVCVHVTNKSTSLKQDILVGYNLLIQQHRQNTIIIIEVPFHCISRNKSEPRKKSLILLYLQSLQFKMNGYFC